MDRTTRIAEEIKKEVSYMIQNELKDPRVTGLISITKILLTKDLKYCTIVCTQIQPSIGIRNWKNEKTPAIRHILLRFILGSFIPFASDTENASIARPIPKSILLKKNTKLHSKFRTSVKKYVAGKQSQFKFYTIYWQLSSRNWLFRCINIL